MAPPTILAHKSAFLTAQTLQLSQNLAPSHAWRNANDAAEQGISQRMVDEALYRLNQTLQQHVRRVYPPQATRLVAEQIDSLFLDVDDAGGEGGDEGDGIEELRVGIDLTTDEAISSLPQTWDAHRPDETEAQPVEAEEYTNLQSSLTSLSERRAAAKARVERLRQMQSLLQPFEDDVQENLVTRNGEVEKELERMRVLLVRVAGRVGQLPDQEETDDEVMEDLDVLERRKVKSLLSGL
ncbi:putative Kinetochore protein fta4 [Seiridium cardinale]